MGTGILLCGSSINWKSNFLAALLGIAGLGASRAVVDATTNEDANAGFGRVIQSCLARGKPFRVTIAFNSNQDWKTIILAGLASWTITWPIEAGYSSAGTLAWSVVMSDFTITGRLEDRILAECELTPSGSPTITPGSV